MNVLLQEFSRSGGTDDAALLFPEAPVPPPVEAGRGIPGNFPASCLLHGVLLAVVFAFSPVPAEVPQPKAYHISLIDIVLPALADSTQASPLSEPAPIQPAPEPAAATRQGKPAKKTAAAHTPPVEAAPSGGDAPLNFGGFAAYGEDAVDQPPAVAAEITPEYPPRARRMNVEGRVEVRLVVDEAGKPQACAVHKAEPAGYFEEAALAAARKTRFLPGKLRGRPVNTLVHLSFVFVLS